MKITLTSIPSCVSGTYNWGAAGVIRVKQTNDFKGAPGNDFVRTTANSLTATSGATVIWRSSRGTSRRTPVKDQPITDAPFSGGGSIQVGLYDVEQNLVRRSTARAPLAAGCVTSGYIRGDGNMSATLGGTTSLPLVNGIASFGDLSLDKASPLNASFEAVAYRLTFASPGVTGTTSDPFAIVETGTACNGPCTLDAEFLGRAIRRRRLRTCRPT